jgi:(p)ppGpp synthase/HD superfamily hydrolase
MATLERAIEIAAAAHAGASDKAGHPYILHPLRVLLAVESIQERIAAALHDVVEDTAWTIDQLRAEGFSGEVIEAVDALTKRPGESRLDAARRAAAHPIALRVKLADVTDNMDLSRIARPSAQDEARLAEYRAVKAYLQSVLDGTDVE